MDGNCNTVTMSLIQSWSILSLIQSWDFSSAFCCSSSFEQDELFSNDLSTVHLNSDFLVFAFDSALLMELSKASVFSTVHLLFSNIITNLNDFKVDIEVRQVLLCKVFQIIRMLSHPEYGVITVLKSKNVIARKENLGLFENLLSKFCRYLDSYTRDDSIKLILFGDEPVKQFSYFDQSLTKEIYDILNLHQIVPPITLNSTLNVSNITHNINALLQHDFIVHANTNTASTKDFDKSSQVVAKTLTLSTSNFFTTTNGTSSSTKKVDKLIEEARKYIEHQQLLLESMTSSSSLLLAAIANSTLRRFWVKHFCMQRSDVVTTDVMNNTAPKEQSNGCSMCTDVSAFSINVTMSTFIDATLSELADPVNQSHITELITESGSQAVDALSNQLQCALIYFKAKAYGDESFGMKQNERTQQFREEQHAAVQGQNNNINANTWFISVVDIAKWTQLESHDETNLFKIMYHLVLAYDHRCRRILPPRPTLAVEQLVWLSGERETLLYQLQTSKNGLFMITGPREYGKSIRVLAAVHSLGHTHATDAAWVDLSHVYAVKNVISRIASELFFVGCVDKADFTALFTRFLEGLSQGAVIVFDNIRYVERYDDVDNIETTDTAATTMQETNIVTTEEFTGFGLTVDNEEEEAEAEELECVDIRESLDVLFSLIRPFLGRHRFVFVSDQSINSHIYIPANLDSNLHEHSARHHTPTASATQINLKLKSPPAARVDYAELHFAPLPQELALTLAQSLCPYDPLALVQASLALPGKSHKLAKLYDLEVLRKLQKLTETHFSQLEGLSKPMREFVAERKVDLVACSTSCPHVGNYNCGTKDDIICVVNSEPIRKVLSDDREIERASKCQLSKICVSYDRQYSKILAEHVASNMSFDESLCLSCLVNTSTSNHISGGGCNIDSDVDASGNVVDRGMPSIGHLELSVAWALCNRCFGGDRVRWGLALDALVARGVLDWATNHDWGISSGSVSQSPLSAGRLCHKESFYINNELSQLESIFSAKKLTIDQIVQWNIYLRHWAKELVAINRLAFDASAILYVFNLHKVHFMHVLVMFLSDSIATTLIYTQSSKSIKNGSQKNLKPNDTNEADMSWTVAPPSTNTLLCLDTSDAVTESLSSAGMAGLKLPFAQMLAGNITRVLMHCVESDLRLSIARGIVAVLEKELPSGTPTHPY